MDKNELKQRIAEVAEIKDLTPKKDPIIRLNDGVDETVRVGDEWVEINSKLNPTLGFEFIRLKDQHRVCELGCGDIIANQVIEKRLAFHPQKHWRTRCQTCSKYVSPDGKGFIEGGHQIGAAYIKYYNALKGIHMPVQVTKVNPETNQEYEETINNDSVIRRYK